MKLSVLVPIYNVSKYLTQCLDSLKAQSLDSMEILCLNDGSTDESKSIIERFVKEDARFKLIDKPNTGYGNTMNVGLNQATGEYIAIVESDDFVEPDMMEKLVELIVKSNADMVKSNFFSFDEASDESRFYDSLEGLPIGVAITGIDNPKIFSVNQSIWSGIYRSDFLKNNNIRFHETPGASFQDISFAFQVLANAKSIMLTKDAYYHYRTTNPNSSVKLVNKLDKLCSEIDYCNDLISSRSDRKVLEPIVSRLAYRVLLENYHAAVPEYQFAILNELARQLRIYESRGDFSADVWDNQALATAKEIMADKDAYYKKTRKPFFEKGLWQGTMNAQVYKDAILEKAGQYENIVLYGAGIVGKKIKEDLLNNGIPKSKLHFAITSQDNTPAEIDGIPVRLISEYKENQKNSIFIITVKEANQYEMLKNLKDLGIENILFLSDEVRSK